MKYYRYTTMLLLYIDILPVGANLQLEYSALGLIYRGNYGASIHLQSQMQTHHQLYAQGHTPPPPFLELRIYLKEKENNNNL